MSLTYIDDPHIYEVLDGRTYKSGLGGIAIGRTIDNLLMRVFPMDESGSWWIFRRPDVFYENDNLVPDLAGWRRERVPVFSDRALRVVPDWIAEVLTPETAGFDRVRKLPAFARFGVANAWVVDPRDRIVEVYRLVAGRWTLISAHESDDVVRAEPFEEIEIPLASVWLPA